MFAMLLKSLSTHADWQGVDISVTDCLFVCFCNFVLVRLRIYPPRIKLTASNFARRFIGVLGREYPILENFAPPEAQNWTNIGAEPSLAYRPRLTESERRCL